MSVWQLPFPKSTINDGYGMRFHPILKVWKMHNGTDFGIGRGTPIYAVTDGVVQAEGSNLSSNGYGHWLRMRASDGMYVIYCHMLEQSALSAGQSVKRGQLIGYVGMSGGATGYHLHLGVSTGIEVGWVNPVTYIEARMDGTPGSGPSAPANPGGQYTVNKSIPGYTTSAKAAARSGSNSTVPPGTYAVFNQAAGMINVTRKAGVPGWWINPGDNVVAPAPTPTPTPTPTPPAPTQEFVTVQKGDSIWAIAKRRVGGSNAQINAEMHRIIALNPQIANPSVIFAGQQIRVR